MRAGLVERRLQFVVLLLQFVVLLLQFVVLPLEGVVVLRGFLEFPVLFFGWKTPLRSTDPVVHHTRMKSEPLRHLLRLPSAPLDLLGEVRPDRLPAFPVVFGVCVEALLAKHEKQAPFRIVAIGTAYSVSKSSPCRLVPDDLVPDRHSLGLRQACAVPEPPEVRRVAPYVRAAVVRQMGSPCLPPIHLEGVELLAV